jgi:hypothetical protein
MHFFGGNRKVTTFHAQPERSTRLAISPMIVATIKKVAIDRNILTPIEKARGGIKQTAAREGDSTPTSAPQSRPSLEAGDLQFF